MAGCWCTNYQESLRWQIVNEVMHFSWLVCCFFYASHIRFQSPEHEEEEILQKCGRCCCRLALTSQNTLPCQQNVTCELVETSQEQPQSLMNVQVSRTQNRPRHMSRRRRNQVRLKRYKSQAHSANFEAQVFAQREPLRFALRSKRD